jgi:uncharacterized membrane protein
VLLEKLRDPYFAKIVLGIPAVLILLLAVSSYLQLGWEPVAAIVGLYLLLRIFNVDELVIGVLEDLRFSFERTSWIGYVGAAAILAIAVFVGYQTAQNGIAMKLAPDKLVALVVGSTVWIALIGLLMIMAGKGMDAINDRKKYTATKYLLYSSAAVMATVVVMVGSMWIANMNEPYVDFGTFLLTIAASVVFGYIATWSVNWYRKEILLEMKIEGKEAISEHGAYLGRIVGVDARKGRLVVQTIFEKKFTVPITAVSSVEDSVIVKSGD